MQRGARWIGRFVATAIDVERDRDVWVDFAHTGDARLQQLAQVVPVRRAARHAVVARRLTSVVAAVKQHTGRDLVADLH